MTSVTRWLVLVVVVLFSAEPQPRAAPAAPPVIAAAPERHASDHGCSSGFERFTPAAEQPGAPELHVIGLYKGREVEGPHGVTPQGVVHVEVARPGHDVVLAMTLYDSARWTVTASPGTRLKRIIVAGRAHQDVSAPSGVAIETFDEAETAYRWPSAPAERFVHRLVDRTGVALTSFRGCYDSFHFTIGDEAATVDAKPPGGPLASCAAVMSESRRCMAIARRGARILVVGLGLDSGRSCLGPALQGVEPYGNAMLGWIGDRLYTCTNDHRVAEISIATGAARLAGVACESVTNVGTSLVVVPSHEEARDFSNRIQRYASFDALRAGQATDDITLPQRPALLSIRGKTAYYAPGQSTSSIQVAQLGATTPSATIKLDHWDDWLFGLDVLPNGTLVVGSPSRTKRDVRMFDGKTGAQLASFALAGDDGDIAGIRCESN